MTYTIHINGENRTTTIEELKKWPMPSNSWVWYNNEWMTQRQFLERYTLPAPSPKPNNNGPVVVTFTLLLLLALAATMFTVTRGSSPSVRSAAASPTPGPTVTKTETSRPVPGPTVTVTRTETNQPTSDPSWPSWTGDSIMWGVWDKTPIGDQVKFCQEYTQDPEAAAQSWRDTLGATSNAELIIEWLAWYCPQWASGHIPKPYYEH